MLSLWLNNEEQFNSSYSSGTHIQEIAARSLPGAGRRQVAFNIVKTLLCYGLFYILDPHHYLSKDSCEMGMGSLYFVSVGAIETGTACPLLAEVYLIYGGNGRMLVGVQSPSLSAEISTQAGRLYVLLIGDGHTTGQLCRDVSRQILLISTQIANVMRSHDLLERHNQVRQSSY